MSGLPPCTTYWISRLVLLSINSGAWQMISFHLNLTYFREPYFSLVSSHRWLLKVTLLKFGVSFFHAQGCLRTGFYITLLSGDSTLAAYRKFELPTKMAYR